jgi:SAM-dependent methyltransferase
LKEPFYDTVLRTPALLLPRTKIALAFATGLRVSRALDLGSGDGEVSAELARLTGATVVCADISERAVQACRTRGLEAHQVELDKKPLPFPNESFELVFMTEVIEHLVSPDTALEEVRRIMTPDGYLILSTPNLACLPNRLLLPLGIQPLFSEVSEHRVLGRYLSILGQGGRPVGHLRLYTKRALLEFLETCGFKRVRVKGAALHVGGPMASVERITSISPDLAMILVVLAQKAAQPLNRYATSGEC